MLSSVVRQQRATLHKVLAASQVYKHAVTAIAATPSISATPARSFAAAAAPKGKKAAAAAAAAAAQADVATAALESSLELEYSQLPAIPKPQPSELEELCLSEEQLRFAKRPMPDAKHRFELLPAIYCNPETSILHHTFGDMGKYYEVPESVQRSIPPQLHRSMSQEFMGGGNYQMVRRPGLEITRQLAKIDQGTNVKKRVFGVRGSSGCGKSAALHYAAQWVRAKSAATPEKPWLLVATRGEEFAYEKRGFISPSTVKPGVYDQALYTMDFFANMMKTEEKALRLISLKRKEQLADVQWPEGNDGQTLYDLVLLASQDRAQAPRLLYDFTAELKLQTEVPVAVIVDNLNIWDQVCDFIEPLTYNKLEPRKLALVDAFSWFTKQAPKNGASIWSLTTRHATLKDAFHHFSYRPVQGVDSWWYSSQELKHCIIHYSVSEFILSPVNQEMVVRVAGLTGRVPRGVFQQAFYR